MVTEVASFFEGAAPSTCLGVAAATTEEEVDRDFTLTPTKEMEERHIGTIPEERRKKIVYPEMIYVWKTLYLVHSLPE